MNYLSCRRSGYPVKLSSGHMSNTSAMGVQFAHVRIGVNYRRVYLSFAHVRMLIASSYSAILDFSGRLQGKDGLRPRRNRKEEREPS